MPVDVRGPDQPPPHLIARVPSIKALHAALRHSAASLAAHTAVYRTAGDPKYLLPETFHNAYRFGPPRELRLPHGALPYAWFYVALDVQTAIWEGRFARNDATRPGQFYLDPSAVKTGVVGQMPLAATCASGNWQEKPVPSSESKTPSRQAITRPATGLAIVCERRCLTAIAP